MKRNVATFGIMAINVIFFFLMVAQGVDLMSPGAESIAEWGGNSIQLFSDGGLWRIVSHMFVHFGLIHLVMNMYALFYIGRYLEPLLGSVRFGIYYLIAGVFSGFVSLWWHLGVDTIAAGASGAVFGMFGVFLALLSTNLISNAMRVPLIKSIAAYVGYNLVYGLIHSNIDNAAHIGGCVAGLVLGYVYYLSLKKARLHLASHILVIALLPMVGFGVLKKYRTSDAYRFDQAFASYVALEKEVMQQVEEGATVGDIVMKKTQLNAILAPLENLRLKQAKSEVCDRLLKYGHLRSRQWELYLKSLAQGFETPSDIQTMAWIHKELDTLTSQE